MLYNIIIKPIEIIVGWVFSFFILKMPSLGVIGAIWGVSIVINILALPLYNVAEDLQEKERITARKLEPRVKRIKKAFKGNEQFLMLSTYYRQNNYHPLYALKGSLPILIEVPFFIAAYHYLRNCKSLVGASFWIFNNLGEPDALFSIGGFTINILPIIMTLINLVSGAVYTKGAPFREKIQLYCVTVLFLVLLYTSPSGLVIYWILNNIFSLIKNIILKSKWMTLIMARKEKIKEGKKNRTGVEGNGKIDFWIVFLGGLGLACLCGLLLPTSVIATSPAEFSTIGGSIKSPLYLVGNSFCIFGGFFVFWPMAIYKMFDENVRSSESVVIVSALMISLLNAFVLVAEYGHLSVFFDIEGQGFAQSIKQNILALLLGGLIIVGILFIKKKEKVYNVVPYILLSICIAEASISGMKISNIANAYSAIANGDERYSYDETIDTEYNLSKTGQNVIVLFLDRALTSYVPRIMEEFPEIRKQFEGFVYYHNTASFSDYTVEASPAMLGGYEYTPEAINERDTELLVDKHNEALLVMPKLFEDAGFEITVTDPPWPGYQSVVAGDLSLYDDYPEMNVSQIEGKYYYAFSKQKGIADINVYDSSLNGCVDFSVVQCLPPFLRGAFYYGMHSYYLESDTEGYPFFEALSNLYFLPEMTDFTSSNNTFTFLESSATHNVYVTLADDYETVAEVQTENIAENHYQANVAALKQVGKWLDYLRENDAFDNSRIIIVSDHGREFGKGYEDYGNDMTYGAMLFEKDFNSIGELEVSEEFMTNADTIFLAKEGLPVSNVNPFTGKKFEMDKENGVNVYQCNEVFADRIIDDYQFKINDEGNWHVSEDIYDADNWIDLKEWKKNKENAK